MLVTRAGLEPGQWAMLSPAGNSDDRIVTVQENSWVTREMTIAKVSRKGVEGC